MDGGPTSLISVVMPSFNSGKYVRESIQSVLAQEQLALELIIQDGGSQDQTQAVVESFGDDRILFSSEPDAGQSDALNKALGRARGEWILWLNADDVLESDAFQRVSQALTGDADVVYGDFALIDGDGRRLRRYHVRDWEWRRIFSRGCYIFSGATFFRRSVFERFGRFDQTLRYCMDMEFLLRIGRSVEARHVPALIGSLRMHSDSKGGTSTRGFVQEAFQLRRQYARKSPALWPLATLATTRDVAYLLTRRLWLSRAWSAVRPEKEL